MKILDGIQMTDEFYEYVIYKKQIGEIVNFDIVFTEEGTIIAKEYIISETEKLNMKIYNIIKLLQKTDYIDNKLTEAIAEYIATGDNTNVLALREQYKVELQNRASWRLEINKLENTLKN